MNISVLKETITKLIEDQERGTWKQVCADFQMSSKESFLKHMVTTENPKEEVIKFCKTINMPVKWFGDYYSYLRSNPYKS